MPQSPRFRRAEANTDDISLFHVRPWSSASPLVMTAAPKPSVTEKKDKVLTFVGNLFSVSVFCPIQKSGMAHKAETMEIVPQKTHMDLSILDLNLPPIDTSPTLYLQSYWDSPYAQNRNTSSLMCMCIKINYQQIHDKCALMIIPLSTLLFIFFIGYTNSLSLSFKFPQERNDNIPAKNLYMCWVMALEQQYNDLLFLIQEFPSGKKIIG